MVFCLDESPRGAPILLSSLWEELWPEAGPEGTHGPAHRRKTVHLWALWQGICSPALTTHPSPPSLQQNDLHSGSKGRSCFLVTFYMTIFLLSWTVFHSCWLIFKFISAASLSFSYIYFRRYCLCTARIFRFAFSLCSQQQWTLSI